MVLADLPGLGRAARGSERREELDVDLLIVFPLVGTSAS
jgi:hypothetical protein